MQVALDFWRDLPARPRLPERLFFAFFLDQEISKLVERFTQRFLRENRLEGAAIKTARRHGVCFGVLAAA